LLWIVLSFSSSCSIASSTYWSKLGDQTFAKLITMGGHTVIFQAWSGSCVEQILSDHKMNNDLLNIKTTGINHKLMGW
jgi:predicted DNA-binding transcriptional regulator AlpA